MAKRLAAVAGEIWTAVAVIGKRRQLRAVLR